MNKPNSAVARMKALAQRAEPPKVTAGRELEIPLNKIIFDKDQPRSDFHHMDGQVAPGAQMTLEELAESIRANDLISPITVEALEDGTYRVLVGERRTRAHLLIGKTTIRAIVNDTLAKGDRKKRLLFQMAENVNREDLNESDMARNIKFLMEGQDDSPPMTQSQIAKELGKSEGWVSRYVRFSDDELRRLWVETGIADTVENLYRISVLPKPMQADIQRRVALDINDAEFLSRPLARSVIDGFSKDARDAKRSGKAGGATRSLSTVASSVDQSSTPGQTSGPSAEKKNGLEVDAPTDNTVKDGITESLAQMAAEGQKTGVEGTATGKGSNEAGTEKVSTDAQATNADQPYSLPAGAREAILNSAQVELDSKKFAQPPVNLRVNMSNLEKLLACLDAEELKDFNSVSLLLTLPGPLAQRIANSLAGVVVDPVEVPSVVLNKIISL